MSISVEKRSWKEDKKNVNLIKNKFIEKRENEADVIRMSELLLSRIESQFLIFKGTSRNHFRHNLFFAAYEKVTNYIQALNQPRK